MAARQPPALPDEIVEEILLRIPPDDPARLVRAAVACKRWCRLVSGPAFRRRFGELHRNPPILGVISNIRAPPGSCSVRFAPTCSFRPRHADRRGWRAHHSRHGRVLLHREPWKYGPCSYFTNTFAVWDPVTDKLRELPPLPPWANLWLRAFNARVLCAAATRGHCDHLDCSRESFLVVVMADFGEVLTAYVYSSEADVWSEQTSCSKSSWLCDGRCAAHVGNALYFVLYGPQRILEYDLGTQEMTMIDPPPMLTEEDDVIPMTARGGGLGCAVIKRPKLYLWSGEVGPDSDIRWERNRSIELKKLFPVGHIMFHLDVVRFADGGGFIYVTTNNGSFTTNLKSGRCREIEGASVCDNFLHISFCTPAIRVASIGEGPEAGASNA